MNVSRLTATRLRTATLTRSRRRHPLTSREDRIFHVILPAPLLAEGLEAESPGDWGHRILEEGDLLSPLAA